MKPMHLPWGKADMPNAALDILRGCNCLCPKCFNTRHAEVKSLALVERELDILLQSRNLHTITISGGEPLLHPQLPDIVRLCRARNLHVSILSNGILLDAKIAAELRDAGCEALFLHIQKEQKRPDLPEGSDAAVRRLREDKARLLLEFGVIPGLSLTVARTRISDLAFQLKEYMRSPVFEYLLLTIEQDVAKLADRSQRTDIVSGPILDTLKRNGFSPFSFLGGQFRRNIPRWFAFQTARRTDAAGEKTVAAHPIRASLLEHAALRIQRRIEGRYSFLTGTPERILKLRLLLNSLLGGNLSALPFLCSGIMKGNRFQNKHIVLEFPPFWIDGKNIEVCENCPDMTVRDGKLSPLCIADFTESSSCI